MITLSGSHYILPSSLLTISDIKNGNILEPPNSGHLWTTASFFGSQGWPLCSGLTVFHMSQGQLFKMHLLESRLLNTFFKYVICSTENCHLLDRKKYSLRVPRVNFQQFVEQLTQFFATVKYKSSIFSYRDDKICICCTCS